MFKTGIGRAREMRLLIAGLVYLFQPLKRRAVYQFQNYRFRNFKIPVDSVLVFHKLI